MLYNKYSYIYSLTYFYTGIIILIFTTELYVLIKTILRVFFSLYLRLQNVLKIKISLFCTYILSSITFKMNIETYSQK